MNKKFKAIIFDWGDTIMRDFPEKPGPMYSWDKVELIADAKEVLEYLKNKYSLVIATNAGQSDTAAMRKALNRAHVEHYFDHCFSSKDIGFEKPDLRFFNEICRQLSFLPHQCVMIGNDYKKDIEGAFAAGLTTVFFNEKLIHGNYHQANYILNKLIEIKNIL